MKTNLFDEALRMIKGQKVYAVMITLMIVISTITLLIATDVNTNMNNSLEDFHSKYTKSTCYGISDSLEDGGTQYAETTRLMNFYKLLSDSQDFSYMQMYDNPSGIIDFKGDKSFDYYSDEPDFYNEMPNNYLYVNSMMIGQEVIDRYKIKVCSGQLFSESDYQGSLKEEKALPVVLGYKYKDYYNIGDVIECDVPFFYKCSTMKVVGFLEKSSSIKYLCYGNTQIVNLDNYVLVPAYDFKDLSLEKDADLYLNMFYYMKCAGILETNLNKEYVQSIINDYSQQCGLPTYYIQSANNIFIDNLDMDLQELSSAFTLVSSFIVGFISIILVCFLVVSYRINEKNYAIMLCNGYGYMRLFFINLFMVVVFCILAFLLGIIVFLFMFHNTEIKLSVHGLLLVMIFYIFEMIICSVVTFVQLRKINIGLLLRSR